jgi:predicted pyridoxine 5'-phosphate oxidase superfamily flavin-nucleotide-binding protein
MAVELPEKIRKAIEEPQFWHLATVNPDGSPQVTTIWVKPQDGKILVNTALGRKKPRNIEHDPRVALRSKSGEPIPPSERALFETLRRKTLEGFNKATVAEAAPGKAKVAAGVENNE